MVNIPGNILAKGNQHLYMTTLDIVAIAIVHPPRIHRGRAYKPDVSSILYTCQYIPFQYLTLKWKVNYVYYFHENKKENVFFKFPMYLCGLLFAKFSVPVSVTRGVSAIRNASTVSEDGLFARLEGLSNIFVHEDCRKTTPEPIQ